MPLTPFPANAVRNEIVSICVHLSTTRMPFRLQSDTGENLSDNLVHIKDQTDSVDKQLDPADA